MRRRIRWLVASAAFSLMACNQQEGNSFKLVSSANKITEEGNVVLRADVGSWRTDKVEFFKGSTKIGEDNNAPFTVNANITLADNGPQVFSAKTLAAGQQQIATAAVEVNISSIEGNVWQTPQSGGSPINGATLTLKHGAQVSTVTTTPSGKFSIPLSNNGSDTFSLTVVPPAGTPYIANTYDDVPLAAYVSEYGAAKEINFLLSGGPAVALPGYAPRWGCLAGKVFDGETPVAGSGPSNAPNRASPSKCDGSAPKDPFTDTSPLKLGEKGLLLFGGFRGVKTRADGSYLMPVITSNGGFATEGSLWAGNFDGSDEAGLENYWTKFAYVPQAKIFINNGQTTTAPDLKLEPFDPITNPNKVVTVPMQHTVKDLEARGFTFKGETADSFSYTDVGFANAITSGDIPLGSYFDFTQPHNIRAYKIPAGKQAQQIAFNNFALKFDAAGNLAAFSGVQQWLDGTTMNRSLNAFFMPVPNLKTPINEANVVSRSPTLSWGRVWENKVYGVTVYDGTTGRAVWESATPNTSITLPIQLNPDTDYLWDVITYEQYEMADIVGISPEARQANRYIDFSRIAIHAPKKNVHESAVNKWRGELRQSFMNSLGYVPNTDYKTYQLLKWRDWRVSASETFAFRTAK